MESSQNHFCLILGGRVWQVESLRKDIEVLSQNHERDVDRKDAIIQMLDRDLEEVRSNPPSAFTSCLNTFAIFFEFVSRIHVCVCFYLDGKINKRKKS